MADYEANMDRIGETACPFCPWRSGLGPYRQRRVQFRVHLDEQHDGALSRMVLPTISEGDPEKA